MDTIFIENLVVWARIGIGLEERMKTQPVRITVAKIGIWRKCIPGVIIERSR